MSDYALLNIAETQKIFDDFPSIDAADLTSKVNALFEPFLFYHRERNKIELWSSCCLQHGSVDKLPRTIGSMEAGVIFGKHGDKVTCPFCGSTVMLKNTSRLGQKRKLLDYKPVIFLNAKGGDLFARCYWARKDYNNKLNDPPLFMLTHAMRFSIGRTEELHEEWGWEKPRWKHNILEGNYDPVHRVITEPFTDGSGYFSRYVPYYVFGLEQLSDSDFKYCQYEHFDYFKSDNDGRRLYCNICKYLAAYSIYPRQIEMLMKTGGKQLVVDLVIGRRKNKNIIKWDAENPVDAFNLNKAELRDFRQSECGYGVIDDYKYLRRRKLKTSFKDLRVLEKGFGHEVMKDFVKTCAKWRIPPIKLIRYLERFTGPRCLGAGFYSLGNAYRDWVDYITMAEQLDYDLTVETVIKPRNLDIAHYNAQQELDLKLAREAREDNKSLSTADKISLIQRKKKYNIVCGGYFIRIAETSKEIVQEGRTLVHCVGGYAERHMSGQTTILFLRSCDAPDRALYTIQMNGDELRQIHGYMNENLEHGKRAPDPRETMRWLLDPWLEWLKKGSPRRKDGTARLPKFKEAKTA